MQTSSGKFRTYRGWHFAPGLERETKRIPFLKNEPEKLLILKRSGQKRTGNEPKIEAEKLLKTRSRGKNEPK